MKDAPIQQKLMTVLLLTCGTALLLTCVAFFAYDFVTFRKTTLQQLSTLGEIIATNSTAALAFDSEEEAYDILRALRAEPHVVAASLYDQEGNLFARYPQQFPADAFPATPGAEGYRFEQGYLHGFQPAMQEGSRLGTLYLRSDMGVIYERFWRFGSIALLVFGVSLLMAYVVSRTLRKQIARPILALAETARAVSDRRDYSVRATKYDQHELGQLTDAFNHMLEEIETQNQALLESEARVRAVFNAALSAVVVMDAAGMIIDWNTCAETMFGWTHEEALGQELAAILIPPRYRDAHRQGLKHFLATGEGPIMNKSIEMSALRRDGTEFPMELSVSAMKTGEALTFCGFITDLTERQEAAKRIQETEERLQNTLDRIAQGYQIIDHEWRYRYVNNAVLEQARTTREDLLGKTMMEVFPDLETTPLFRILETSIREGTPHRFENEFAYPDGDTAWFLLSVQPVPEGLVILSQDITERKRADQKLQAQLARLDLLSHTTRAIAERQDLNSIFQVMIRSLEDHLPIDFGCVCLYDPVQEALTVTSVGVKSQPLALELAMPEQANIEIDQNGLSRCVQGQLVYEPDISEVPFPFPQRMARGGLRALVVAPLLVESSVFGVLVAARQQAHSFSSGDCEFLRQLSEHVALAAHQAQLYSALQKAYDDLRQTQQAIMQQERLSALGQMASGIAHDINNAISPVALYTESLLENEPALSTRAREYLEIIQQAIDDVAATVTRMREFYRQNEHALALTPVHLDRLVQQVMNLTRARWSDMPQERGIMIEAQTDLLPDLPPIRGVEGEIREALTNLIFNAVDAMPEGGTLTLRTRVIEGLPRADAPGPKRVLIEVIDTGVGMDEATRRRCLEPFFTTKGKRGTGLGLAMVYGVAQRHGATIEIESAVGAGTTMRLIFPAHTPVDATPTPAQTSYDVPSRLRILIVDDDPLLLKSLGDILETDGHAVTPANSGQAGLNAFHAAQARDEPFAVVITDLGMPYMDGRQVARNIKEAAPSTPVILLTGWGQRMVAEGDIPAHVDQVLSKPPRLRELREALAHAFNHQKLDH